MTEEFSDGGAEVGNTGEGLGAIQAIKDTESVAFPNASIATRGYLEVLIDQRLPLQLSLPFRMGER